MSSFKARRIKRTYTQKILAAPDRVFPLLCPQRELDWLDGWNYEMIYSESGLAEHGAIFRTKHEEKTDTVWIVSRYDKDRNVAFVRITPEIVITDIDLLLEDKHDGTTDLHVTYTFTALSEKGNDFIEGNSARQFLDMMKWWEKSLNYYIQSGKKLMALKL
jgi:hypothetical protein